MSEARVAHVCIFKQGETEFIIPGLWYQDGQDILNAQLSALEYSVILGLEYRWKDFPLKGEGEDMKILFDGVTPTQLMSPALKHGAIDVYVL